jgi:hypothetical protein
MGSLDTWLKELRLSGYRVTTMPGTHWITVPRATLLLTVDSNAPEGWRVKIYQGSGRAKSKIFTEFQDMADFVNEKLRSWPDHWSRELPPGEMPDD